MPITTFKGLFEGKQAALEEKMDADAVLCKLEDYKIITFVQGSKIEVSLYLMYSSFYRAAAMQPRSSVSYPYVCMSVCLPNV